jgi:drug/metabolite transporter (DMT)-like permease
MPATALGNVFVVLLAYFWLHDKVSPLRWMGVVLITVAVGFVAQGPISTTPPLNLPDPVDKAEDPPRNDALERDSVVKEQMR